MEQDGFQGMPADFFTPVRKNYHHWILMSLTERNEIAHRSSTRYGERR